MSVVCSRRATLLGAVGDLPHRSLDVFGQNLRGGVAALRPDLPISQFRIAHFGKSAVPEGSEGKLFAQSGGENDLLDLSAH